MLDATVHEFLLLIFHASKLRNVVDQVRGFLRDSVTCRRNTCIFVSKYERTGHILFFKKDQFSVFALLYLNLKRIFNLYANCAIHSNYGHAWPIQANKTMSLSMLKKEEGILKRAVLEKG